MKTKIRFPPDEAAEKINNSRIANVKLSHLFCLDINKKTGLGIKKKTSFGIIEENGLSPADENGIEQNNIAFSEAKRYGVYTGKTILVQPEHVKTKQTGNNKERPIEREAGGVRRKEYPTADSPDWTMLPNR